MRTADFLSKLRPWTRRDAKENNYYTQLERLLTDIVQLLNRSGGSSSFGQIFGVISLFQPNEHSQVLSGDYTTLGEGNEFYQVTQASTITLSSSPSQDNNVTIQPTGNFLVTVVGAINGGTQIIMHHAYDLMHLRYDVDLGWQIV